MLGPLPAGEMERLFRAADAFAFPSVKEGFGLAALEALAAELPVVASDLDVFRGFLVDERERAAHARPATAPRSAARWPGSRSTRSSPTACAPAAAPSCPAHTWDAAAAAHERAYEAFLGARVG